MINKMIKNTDKGSKSLHACEFYKAGKNRNFYAVQFLIFNKCKKILLKDHLDMQIRYARNCSMI